MNDKANCYSYNPILLYLYHKLFCVKKCYNAYYYHNLYITYTLYSFTIIISYMITRI